MSDELTQDQAPVSISERISSYLASEESPVDEVQDESEAPPEEVQQAEEAADDAGTEATADEPPQEEEELEITHNGESKRLKKSEALELAQKGFDYTQKTQQLAEERRQFEANAQAMQQSIAMQNALQDQFSEVKALDRQLEAFKGVNWHEMAESDPVQYLKINQTFRDLKEAREAKVQELQGLGQQLQQQQESQQVEAIRSGMPVLKEKIGWEPGNTVDLALTEYCNKIGLKDKALLIAKPSYGETVWKAMQYDALQKAKPAIEKKVANLPKPVTPGNSQGKAQRQAEQMQQLRQQLKKTGKLPKGLLAKFL